MSVMITRTVVAMLGALVLCAAQPVFAGTAPINLNTASATELASLKGIGPAKAQAIVSHRSANPFRKPEDLRDVKGIGDKLYDSIKDQVTVGDAPSPKGHGS